MHLPGDHKIDLEWLYGYLLKIDSLRAAAFGKKHQVIKRMFMRQMQITMAL